MSIVDQLSSQVGDRTQEANRRVVAKCLRNHALLTEVAQGLNSKEARLVGDCAEVLTQVAEKHPELVAPYAESLELWCNYASRCISPFNPRLIILQAAT
jgi:hypothetical protein